MEYIELINEFWRKFSIQKFSPEEVSLYFFLLNHAISEAKNMTFKLPLLHLERNLGSQINNLHEVHEQLKNRGVIVYNEDSSQSTFVYTLIMS